MELGAPGIEVREGLGRTQHRRKSFPGLPQLRRVARCDQSLRRAHLVDAFGRQRELHAHELLRRPDVRYADLMAVEGIGPGVSDARVAEQIEVQARYSGYLERQQAEISRQQRYQEQALPADFDYNAVRGLSNEACEKLQAVRPLTIGQASRIPGITPAAVSLLLIYLRKRGHTERQSA